MLILRRILRPVVFVVLPALLLWSLVVGAVSFPLSIGASQLASVLFLVALCTGPLLRIFPRFQPLRVLLFFRREIGVAGGLLFVWHGAFYMIKGAMPWHSLSLGLEAAGLLLLLPVLLTSFDGAVRALGHRWRFVQYLAIPGYFLILLHAGIEIGNMAPFLAVMAIVLGVRVWAGLLAGASSSLAAEK